MLPFGQAKNIAICIETLNLEQELRLAEAIPEPRVLPTALAIKNLSPKQRLQSPNGPERNQVVLLGFQKPGLLRQAD